MPSPETSPTRRSAALTARRSTRPPRSGSNGSPVNATTKPNSWQATTIKHSSCAGRLGEDISGIAPKALAAFTEAAHQAQAVYAHPAAARHYHAALELTSSVDVEQRASLLWGEATVRFEANTADERLLRAAVEAQVLAEAWESAAMAERVLSVWYQEQAARGDESSLHLAQAADYAARVPPGDAMCRIAADQAFDLIISGHADQALTLTSQLIPTANQVGLEVGGALLLMWQGYARVALSDAHGTRDMRSAADTLAQHAHSSTSTAYGNLADALRGLGDMSAADEAYTAANEWAKRVASGWHIGWIAGEMAVQAYHGADWDRAQRLLAETDMTGGYNDVEARTTTGRIALACGDFLRALADAEAMAGYATSARNKDASFNAIALLTACRRAEGRGADALHASEDFLSRWQESAGTTTRAIELCEIAPTLATANKHEEIRTAALLLPEASRWRNALMLIADERYSDAATLYMEIGSQPLAADANLLAARQAADQGRTADAHRHAEAVLDFAELTGASLYERRAEAFVKASA